MRKAVIIIFSLLCSGFIKAQYTGGNNSGYGNVQLGVYVPLNNCIMMGIIEMNKRSLLRVYPNPASEAVKIEGADFTEVILKNVLGSRVKSFSNTSLIDIADLSEGVYFLEIKNDRTTISLQKIIKCN